MFCPTRLAKVGTDSKFSATVLPVTVMQSPCKNPASSSSFMTAGTPPTVSKSTMCLACTRHRYSATPAIIYIKKRRIGKANVIPSERECHRQTVSVPVREDSTTETRSSGGRQPQFPNLSNVLFFKSQKQKKLKTFKERNQVTIKGVHPPYRTRTMDRAGTGCQSAGSLRREHPYHECRAGSAPRVQSPGGARCSSWSRRLRKQP